MNWGKISFNIFVFLVFLPIFFYVGAGEIRFDALGGWDQKLEKSILPPLPVSQIIVSFFAIVFFKYIISNKFVLFAIFVISLNLFVLLMTNLAVNSRYIIISIELINLIIAYLIFNHANNRYWNNLSLAFKHHSLCTIAIVIGLLCIFSNYVLNQEPYNFITESVTIYNYYDYFSVLFGAMFIFALINKQLSSKTGVNIILLFLLFYYFATVTNSRAVLYSVFLVLMFVLFLKICKVIFKKEVPYNFIFFLMLTISILYLFAAYSNAFYYLDGALQDRARMIIGFFNSMTFLSLFFPLIMEFRIEGIDGSLHNELLEIFSNFGVIGVVLVYTFLYKALLNKNKNFQSSILIIFIFLMSLFQLNLYHPYSANLLMLLIAIHSNKPENIP